MYVLLHALKLSPLHDVEIGTPRFTQYIGLAGYTILLYDHLITFDDEVCSFTS